MQLIKYFFLIYKKLLQTFRKYICLVIEFYFINSFIVVFWRILRQVSQLLPRKAPLIFRIFSVILSICCCYLVVYYLTKPLWYCVRASEICCSGCCNLSLSLSVWPYMYRILICKVHMIITAGVGWKFSYILEPAEVLHVIFRLQV